MVLKIWIIRLKAFHKIFFFGKRAKSSLGLHNYHETLTWYWDMSAVFFVPLLICINFITSRHERRHCFRIFHNFVYFAFSLLSGSKAACSEQFCNRQQCSVENISLFSMTAEFMLLVKWFGVSSQLIWLDCERWKQKSRCNKVLQNVFAMEMFSWSF